MLEGECAIEVVGWVDGVAGEGASVDPREVVFAQVEASSVRCPDPEMSARFEKAIASARDSGDSLGGWVAVVAREVPAGWGDPVFAKLKGLFASAMLSIPAAVAFEIGDGIAATARCGSENNDPLISDGKGGVTFGSNRSGGLLGGISSGAPIYMRVGFKPTSTVQVPQQTVDREGREVEFEGSGRHDPCVLPRAVPVVEAMLLLVLADRMLARRASPPSKREER